MEVVGQHHRRKFVAMEIACLAYNDGQNGVVD